MISKMFYKFANVKKINKILAVIGILLLLWSGYFLFKGNSLNQFFVIGVSGLFFSGVSLCSYFYEKKFGNLNAHEFICIFDFCAAVLFLMFAIYDFCNQEIFYGIFLAVISIIMVLIVQKAIFR